MSTKIKITILNILIIVIQMSSNGQSSLQKEDSSQIDKLKKH